MQYMKYAEIMQVLIKIASTEIMLTLYHRIRGCQEAIVIILALHSIQSTSILISVLLQVLWVIALSLH